MRLNIKAFTLIELIIVIAIISLIAAAVFVSVNPAKRLGDTKDSQRLADLTAINKAVNLYTADYGSMPTDIDTTNIKKGDKIVLCSTASQLSCDGQTHDCMVIEDANFLGKYFSLPIDPDKADTTDTGYYITRNADRTITFGACDSYSSGANLKVAATTKVEPFIGIYRSVGPTNTTTLASGTSNAMTILGNDLTLTTALANNIGVGDVIQYDSDNNGLIDSLAFIQSRYSSIKYSVVDVDGNTPTQTSSSDTDWDIFRAYTSLANAEAGTENIGIDNSLENFDTWIDGKDLVTADQQWNIALYGDAADTTPGGGTNQGVTILGWNTSAVSYIKIYTPYLSSEVGVSQRHEGVWDDTKANMGLLSPGYYAISLTTMVPHVKIIGLQIFIAGTEGYARGVWIREEDVVLADTIVKNLNTNSNNNTAVYDQSGGNFRMYNSLVYDFLSNGYSGGYAPNTKEHLIYNNTIINSGDCFEGGYQTILYINNIAQDCNNGFSGIDLDSDYNISDLVADAPGSNSINESTLTFANKAADNFHLASGDTDAIDAGVDLSNNKYLDFTKDIDGETRSGIWDIGADEY